MKTPESLRLIGVLCFAMLLVSACNASTPVPTAVALAPTAPLVAPSATSTIPTDTPTASLTLTVAPTDTPLPSPTPTIIPSSTATSVPPTATRRPPTSTPKPTTVSYSCPPGQGGLVVRNFYGQDMTFTINNQQYTVPANGEQFIVLDPGTYPWSAFIPGKGQAHGSATIVQGQVFIQSFASN